MDSVYSRFYQGFYDNCGGLIPTQPLNQYVFPGDFFQIRNGEMLVLGNIFRKSLVSPENQNLEYGIKLNPSSWSFSEGVSKPYSGRGSGVNPIEGEFEFSKQILAFNKIGSYFFRGNNPEMMRIANWQEIQQELIIKLTQTFYSFREVYVVTACATTSDWTLAISDSAEGELEIATESENFGLVDIFGHESCKTIQSKDIAFYTREEGRNPSFFKAKRLAVQNDVKSTFISQFLGERQYNENWIRDFYNLDTTSRSTMHMPSSYHLEGCVLDMLAGNELTPNNALSYFRWDDATKDDIGLLFNKYGR